MPARKALARRKARELLANAKRKALPIAIEELAIQAGATLKYEPFPGELSGMVHRHGAGPAVIGVNSLHSVTRQRFTIAHELAHLFLHKDEHFHVDEKFPIRFRSDISGKGIDDSEIEANQFAAELLMPFELLIREIKRLPDDTGTDEAIRTLAERFLVSEQAMTYRLSGLGVLR